MLHGNWESLSPARSLAQEVEQVVDFCGHFVLAPGVAPDFVCQEPLERAPGCEQAAVCFSARPSRPAKSRSGGADSLNVR